MAYLEELGVNSEKLPVYTEDKGQNRQESNTADGVTSGTEATASLPEYSRVQESEGEAVNEQTALHITLSKISAVEILGLLWIIGMVIVSGFSTVQLLRLNKRVKCSVKVNDVNKGIACIEGIESPFLWGIVHPIIYLPTNMEESEREYIIAHENYHKKRGDHIVKLLVFAVVAIHWFNPLVWAAYVFFIRDMEISCDEAVLSQTTENINKQYANSLLKYAAKQNGFVLTPLTFGEPSLKSRIHNVLKFKKRGVAVTVIAVCVVTLTACGLVLRPQPEEGLVSDKEQEGIEQSGSDTSDGGTQNGSKSGGDAQNGAIQNGAGTGEDGNASASDEKETEYTEREISLAKQFQAVLGIEDANFVETVLQGRDAGLKHIFDDDSGEHYYSYHANLNTSEENGFQCEIRWMKLADSVVLQDWKISLQKELEGLTRNASMNGVFYDETQERIYIAISSLEGPGIEEEGLADTWVLTFPIDDPDNNQLYSYDGAEGAWFGEPLKLGNCLYLHGGTWDIPYEINLETMEGRRCKEELAAAKDAAADFIEEYGEQTGVALSMHGFQTVARYKDITLFAGQIAEAMDFPTVATVYLAMQDGKVLTTKVVEVEEGEINYGFTTERDEVQQLEDWEINWFNDNFFNRAFLDKEATPQEKIRNQFLNCEYSNPEEINLTEVFYNGIGEELTEEDWQCLSGEARWLRPLHTTDLEVLSEEEHAQVAALAQELDVIKVSQESVKSILQQYTGRDDFNIFGGVGMKSAYFNKKDGTFYWIHSDTNMMCIFVEKGYRNQDGSVILIYRKAEIPIIETKVDGSPTSLIFEEGYVPEWASAEQYIAILMPNEEEYQFCVNISIENLKKTSDEDTKEILGTITYVDAETIVIDEKQWVTWQDEEWKEEYDAPNGYMVRDVSDELLECPIAEECIIAVLDEQTSTMLVEYSFEDNYKAAMDRANNLFHVKIKDGEVVYLWEQYEP